MFLANMVLKLYTYLYLICFVIVIALVFVIKHLFSNHYFNMYFHLICYKLGSFYKLSSLFKFVNRNGNCIQLVYQLWL